MFKLPKLKWYEYLYIALAAATFKHTSWGFASVLEGPEPVIEWASLTLDLTGIFIVLELFQWYFWGALMAVATDVGMFFVARAIRENRAYSLKKLSWGLLTAYVIISMISAYTQLLYGVQHAAPLEIVPNAIGALQNGGWIYWLLECRLLFLPLALPGTSVLYTFAFKLDDQLTIEQEKPGTIDAETGERKFSVKEAVLYSGYSDGFFRQKAGKGALGTKNPETGAWEFTQTELDALPAKK